MSNLKEDKIDLRPRAHYKCIAYFVAAFITCYLTQEILLNRLISIFSGYITGGALIYFISPMIVDVVAEVYGYRVARQIVWCGLIAPLFLALCVFIVLHAPSPPFWRKTAMSYNYVLGSIPRVAIVSSITIFCGQMLNAHFISRWKILTQGRYFWLRSIGSSALGDGFTVISSTMVIFYGKLPVELIVKNILTNLTMMLIVSAVGAIPATFLARKVASIEGIDIYNTRVDFNPFKAN